jgi:hypothetical protein
MQEPKLVGMADKTPPPRALQEPKLVGMADKTPPKRALLVNSRSDRYKVYLLGNKLLIIEEVVSHDSDGRVMSKSEEHTLS